MSVHKTTRNGKARWVVRWREGDQQRSRTFDLSKDARDFDAHLRKLNAQGELARELERRRTTVTELVAEWVETRGPEVGASTSASYARHFARRILPQLGQRRAATLTPADVEAWIAWMRREGAQDPTILHAVAALQAVLSLGVRAGVMPANPVSGARKPRQGNRTRVPLIVTVEQVEAIRVRLLHKGRVRDAVLVELLAYAGLRPESEAIVLVWRQLRARSILVRDTKRKRERTVVLLDPLQETLDRWRITQGGADGDLVIPTSTGAPWTRTDWRNWTKRVFRPAAIDAGLPADIRPRDLRGSFVSLLVHEGRSIVEVARQTGHSAAISLRDYAQVYDNTDPADRLPAAERILRARVQQGHLFHQSSTSNEESTVPEAQNPANSRKAAERIRTADPFITSDAPDHLNPSNSVPRARGTVPQHTANDHHDARDARQEFHG